MEGTDVKCAGLGLIGPPVPASSETESALFNKLPVELQDMIVSESNLVLFLTFIRPMFW